MSTTQALRELLAKPGVIRSLGAHDVFTARLIEAAGLETVFLGGFGTSREFEAAGCWTCSWASGRRLPVPQLRRRLRQLGEHRMGPHPPKPIFAIAEVGLTAVHQRVPVTPL